MTDWSDLTDLTDLTDWSDLSDLTDLIDLTDSFHRIDNVWRNVRYTHNLEHVSKDAELFFKISEFFRIFKSFWYEVAEYKSGTQNSSTPSGTQIKNRQFCLRQIRDTLINDAT